MVAAISAQLEKFTHPSIQVGLYEGYIAVAERMNAFAPGDFEKKTLLVTTGSEAVENAVKIARQATGRPAIVSFALGFHGRTVLCTSLTGKVAPYKQNFGPFVPEIYNTPYPDPSRGYDSDRAMAALHELFETEIAPRRIAAFIIEPVLGEGGFVAAPAAFLRELRTIADTHGILLIADEIQCGFGRTGTLFAVEHAGIAPDIILFAKSVAGGMPLAGLVGRADVLDAVEPGGLGGTYAGNPLACAAALAVFEILETENILERARALGLKLRARLDALVAKYPAHLLGVRGIGAMLGLEFVKAGPTERRRGGLRRRRHHSYRRSQSQRAADPRPARRERRGPDTRLPSARTRLRANSKIIVSAHTKIGAAQPPDVPQIRGPKFLHHHDLTPFAPIRKAS